MPRHAHSHHGFANASENDGMNAAHILQPQIDTLVGAVLAGSYRVESQIGQGGMGRVYRGIHLRLKRSIAIKVMHGHLTERPELVTRFEREARAISKIRHPHVVEAIDMVRTPCGRPALVYEYLEGEDLQTYLGRHRVLPLKDALTIARQIASALACAHDMKIIHRDIKPSNVFLIRDLTGIYAKLLDFGVAKIFGEYQLTRTDALVGTPSYMAPEQAKGARYAEACSDIYSVGALLYRMLTGEPPHRARNSTATLSHVLMKEPRRPREISKDIPENVERLIQKAMARDLLVRFSSAQDLVHAIDNIEQHQPSQLKAPTIKHPRLHIAFLTFMIGIMAALSTMSVLETTVQNASTGDGYKLVVDGGVIACCIVWLWLGSKLKNIWSSTPTIEMTAQIWSRGIVASLCMIGTLSWIAHSQISHSQAFFDYPFLVWAIIPSIFTGIATTYLHHRLRAKAANRSDRHPD